MRLRHFLESQCFSLCRAQETFFRRHCLRGVYVVSCSQLPFPFPSRVLPLRIHTERGRVVVVAFCAFLPRGNNTHTHTHTHTRESERSELALNQFLSRECVCVQEDRKRNEEQPIWRLRIHTPLPPIKLNWNYFSIGRYSNWRTNPSHAPF